MTEPTVPQRMRELMAAGWQPGHMLAGMSWADFNEVMDWLDALVDLAVLLATEEAS